MFQLVARAGTVAIVLAGWAGVAFGQALPAPIHVPAPGGEVVLTTVFDKQIYDEDQLSAVRRAGDWLYFSGSVVGASKPIGPDDFEQRLDRVFRLIGDKLCAAGASFADVVAMRSYHAWRNPAFTGTKDEHNAVFDKVRKRYFLAPYPTWTAIGVDQLYASPGLVEIELTAYAPRRRGAGRAQACPK
ncbi:Rid family hydrolase [Sphingomonas panacisoli]|nr:Rid family hydrolase [Sphingomonas panacisoli]